MTQRWKGNHALFLVIVGALAWLLPGAGHYALNEKKRGIIIFAVIAVTFLLGLYVGSIGVIDPVNAKPWFAAQLMNSPAVLLLGHHVADVYYRARDAQQRSAYAASPPDETTEESQAVVAYTVFGRAGEIGQIYTSIAGLLNLLCIVNAVYMAHLRETRKAGA
jgi:hypothetical protein